MIDLTEGTLDTVKEFAISINDNSLQECLDRLEQVDKNLDCITRISNDFADKSFYFTRWKGESCLGNGGIIYHGTHDNGGDGGAPTFSVNITPQSGWCIHT
jgi:hypothetical protein